MLFCAVVKDVHSLRIIIHAIEFDPCCRSALRTFKRRVAYANANFDRIFFLYSLAVSFLVSLVIVLLFFSSHSFLLSYIYLTG